MKTKVQILENIPLLKLLWSIILLKHTQMKINFETVKKLYNYPVTGCDIFLPELSG